VIGRKNRFHGHHSVSKVRGFVVHSKYFSLRCGENKLGDYRLAVVVSKKVAPSAVTRNRIRRKTYEQFRTQGRVANTSLDLIVYAKTSEPANLSAEIVAEEVANLTKKALAGATKR
jgi:ribonuclease P protein component